MQCLGRALSTNSAMMSAVPRALKLFMRGLPYGAKCAFK